MMRRLVALLALVALPALSCDGGRPETEPTVVPTPIDPATMGAVRGKVLFNGTPPKAGKISMASECAAFHETPPFNEEVLVKDGRLKNVFIYVKTGLEELKFAWPSTPLRIANTKCVYTPRVAGVQVNQPVEFANEDLTVHNIHAFDSSSSLFNFSIQGKGSRTHTQRSPLYGARLKCDIHPWMLGWIFALPHPYFQVTGADGAFEIKGLPPGDYTIEAWHEKYCTQSRKAKLDPKGSSEVEFSFGEK